MSDKLNFQADVSKMLDIVVNSLYSEKQIFLRELISNASDACDKLKYMALTHPDIARESGEMKIWITPDAEKNTLTVADNGIGMNRDDLINHLGTIAKSGTADFVKNASDNGSAVDLIGQFGVGFYSAFMVADKVEILTRRAGEDKAWFWVSNGVDGFEIREAEKKTNGTEIKLFLKQDEKTTPTAFICGRLSAPIPTTSTIRSCCVWARPAKKPSTALRPCGRATRPKLRRNSIRNFIITFPKILTNPG